MELPDARREARSRADGLAGHRGGPPGTAAVGVTRDGTGYSCACWASDQTLVAQLKARRIGANKATGKFMTAGLSERYLGRGLWPAESRWVFCAWDDSGCLPGPGGSTGPGSKGRNATGTTGLYLRKPGADDPEGMLVAAHTLLFLDELAAQSVPESRTLYAPSAESDGGNSPGRTAKDDVVGELVAFTRLSFDRAQTNRADAAVVRLSEKLKARLVQARKAGTFDPAALWHTAFSARVRCRDGGAAKDLVATLKGWDREGYRAEGLRERAKGLLGKVDFHDGEKNEPLVIAHPNVPGPHGSGPLVPSIETWGDTVMIKVRQKVGVFRHLGDVSEKHLAEGEKVFKVGRATGVTEGTVRAIDLRVFGFPYSDQHHARIEGAFAISAGKGNPPFACGGDSGAVVFTTDGKGGLTALGTVFGCMMDDGETIALVLPLKDVLEANAFKKLGYEFYLARD